jgi:exodeoxyribonuclease V beta subunit
VSTGALPAGRLAGHPVLAADILRGFHLLEADAGTGKTWTLAGLVVRALVERELPLDRILVVTFTRAATAELAARIRERIEQLAQLIEDRLANRASRVDELFCVAYFDRIADPAAALARLRVALAQIDEAQVRTIHAFCHGVIDEHALSIGVEQGLRAEALGSAWIERGIAAWWRETVLDAPPEQIGLLARTGVSPALLVGPVRAIDERHAARLIPEQGDWRGVAAQLARLRGQLADAIASDEQALHDWVAHGAQVDRRRFQPKRVENWLAALRLFAAGRDAGGDVVPEAAGKLSSDWIRGGSGNNPVPPLGLVAVCDALQALRPALALVPAMVAVEVAACLARRRLELKAGAGTIDHDDLLRFVQRALAQPAGGRELAASLRGRFPLALVDECQDTDALQWDIFRRIYQPSRADGDCALVLVGDPKQAIYAFRGADVYSYLDAGRADPARHALHENQRSQRSLIESVNALFDRETPFLVPQIGFAASREGAKPRKSFDSPASPARGALTVIRLDAGDPSGMLRRPDAQRLSVDATVAEIARLLAGDAVRLDGRALEPRDIAVLVNSHFEGTMVKRALAQAGIGAAEISRDSVLDSRECEELIRLVAAIAEPADARLVRAALATTLIDGRAELFEGVDLAATIERLALARHAWSQSGPQAALRPLLAAAQVGPRLAALRDGDRRLTNLMHLLELLSGSLEAREGARPALRWLMRTRDDPGSIGEEAAELRLESDEDLVRIVTVHKSKGLEYPVVFVPFAWSGRPFRGRDPRGARARGPQPLRYHELQAGGDDAGDAGDPGWRAVVDFASDRPSDAWAQAAREHYSEAMRALYVALTRAEHRCYLCWGAGAGAQFAPLAWLLHGLDPLAQAPWQPRSKDPPPLTDTQVQQGLDAWGARAAQRVAAAVVVVPATAIVEGRQHGAPRDDAPGDAAGASADAAARPPAVSGPSALAARPFLARIPAPWIQTSFSGLAGMLARGEAPEQRDPHPRLERPDHDQAVQEPVRPAGAAAPEAIAPAPMRFQFPAGAQAGTCLHGILEDSAFDEPVGHATASRWLARAGFDRVDPAQVASWLDEVIATPLPDLGAGPVRLSSLPRQRIVREMEFVLAADGVDDRSVLQAIAAEHPLQAEAAETRWDGYLRGFIDLVFEAGGRYHLLDWKSNRLGADWGDYGAERMRQSIDEHAYALQFCLYTLALHRLLRARLRDYDYERHVGGVYYVFLRGAHPRRRAEDGTPLGVHAVRPSHALISRLDALMGRRG